MISLPSSLNVGRVRYPKNDVDGTSLSINTKGQQINLQRQFSEELRIASNGTNTIDYVAGLYYFWQTIRGYGEFAYGPSYAAWNFNPATTNVALANYSLDGFQANQYSDPQTKSYAAFGQVDWHATDALTLTAGLRYSHEDKKGRFEQTWVAGNDLSVLPAGQIATASGFRNAIHPILNFDAELSDDSLSGLATLSYKVTPDILLYATYSRGNKSGGLNLTAGANGRTVVAPEKVDAYELGFKSQFLDRRLTINSALFLTEIRDFQTNVTEPVPGTTNTAQYIANNRHSKPRD